MLILEKIEGDKAVIYRDDERLTVPAAYVKCCEPGSVLICENGVYSADEAATKKRRRDIFRLQESLFDE